MLILITEVWEGDLIPIAVAGSLAAARARAEEHLRKAGELRALRQGEWEDEEGRIWRWLAPDEVRHGMHVHLLQQDESDYPHLRLEAVEEVGP